MSEDSDAASCATEGLTPDTLVRRAHDEHQELASAMWAVSRSYVYLGRVAAVGTSRAGLEAISPSIVSWRKGGHAGGNGVSQASPPDLAGIVCGYAWDCATAQRIVQCESTWNPQAVSPDGQHIGLFQVSLIHRWTYAELIDPVVNVAAAWELYQRSGWRPWSCAR